MEDKFGSLTNLHNQQQQSHHFLNEPQENIFSPSASYTHLLSMNKKSSSMDGFTRRLAYLNLLICLFKSTI